MSEAAIASDAPPLLQKGFRPFFLLCAIFAAISVPLWSVRFMSGWTADWLGMLWHAHEMVFGFFGAMIAGFLLTAVENWTGRRTVTPAQLAGLAILWLLGRAVMFSGDTSIWIMLVDSAFFPALALAIARPILATNNRRNFVIIGILLVLSLLNLLSHHAASDPSAVHWARPALLAAVTLVAALVTLISGRVVPFFTRRALSVETNSYPWIERIVGVLLAALIVLELLSVDVGVGVASVLIGVLLFVRMRGWQTLSAARVPILAVLHLGHIWLALGFLFRGAAILSSVGTSSLGLHLMTLGGLSTIGLGMMVRVSLGHTGRPIIAPLWANIAFGLLTLAILARALAPLFFAASYVHLITCSAILWSAAFGLYVLFIAPVLWSARPDGKPG